MTLRFILQPIIENAILYGLVNSIIHRHQMYAVFESCGVSCISKREMQDASSKDKIQVAGTLGAYLLTAAVMWLAGLKAVFGAAALCLGLMAAVPFFLLASAALMGIRLAEKQGRVSTVSGFLNSVAYLGTAVSAFSIGVMVDHLGWSATITSWILFTASALVVCIVKSLRENVKSLIFFHLS